MLLPLLNVHAHDMHSILFSKLSIMRLCVCSSSLSISFFTLMCSCFLFFFSSRRRHTRWNCDWSSDVCSSDLKHGVGLNNVERRLQCYGEGLARMQITSRPGRGTRVEVILPTEIGDESAEPLFAAAPNVSRRS